MIDWPNEIEFGETKGADKGVDPEHSIAMVDFFGYGHVRYPRDAEAERHPNYTAVLVVDAGERALYSVNGNPIPAYIKDGKMILDASAFDFMDNDMAAIDIALPTIGVIELEWSLDDSSNGINETNGSFDDFHEILDQKKSRLAMWWDVTGEIVNIRLGFVNEEDYLAWRMTK